MIELNIKFGIQGWFRIVAENIHTGKRRELAPWQRNTFLDNGRNNIAVQNNWMQYCQVGTGNTAPTTSDQQLESWVDSTLDIESDTRTTQGSEPWYGSRQVVYRFQPGAIGGQNLQEVAIGWGPGNGPEADIATRALIRNEVGVPVPVTPLVDELLDVQYEVRYYPPLGDTVQNDIVLDGVTYNTTTRALNVSGARWSADIGLKVGNYSLNNSNFRAYDGNIQGITASAPAGNFADCDNANQIDRSYSADSFFVGIQCNTGSEGWNLANDLRSLRCQTTAGEYQTQFGSVVGDLPVPKTNLYTMQIVWNLSFVEEPI